MIYLHESHVYEKTLCTKIIFKYRELYLYLYIIFSFNLYLYIIFSFNFIKELMHDIFQNMVFLRTIKCLNFLLSKMFRLHLIS